MVLYIDRWKAQVWWSFDMDRYYKQLSGTNHSCLIIAWSSEEMRGAYPGGMFTHCWNTTDFLSRNCMQNIGSVSQHQKCECVFSNSHPRPAEKKNLQQKLTSGPDWKSATCQFMMRIEICFHSVPFGVSFFLLRISDFRILGRFLRRIVFAMSFYTDPLKV